jgi:hypothetical protein
MGSSSRFGLQLEITLAAKRVPSLKLQSMKLELASQI